MLHLRINSDRLQTYLTELAQIGALEGGGVCRLAFSPEDKAGRDYVEAQMRALGLEVNIDPLGNILGLRDGEEEGLPVVTGSHVDTVRTGGCYDGSLGVLAGLEVIATLNDAGITTKRPLAVVAFVNEEGARFTPDMMGSFFHRGHLPIEEAYAIVGIDGTTIGENLKALDYAGTDTLPDFHRFVELHIEQGPILEQEELTIGVVTAVQGISWFELTIHGQANHAGTTPTHLRHDAGYVAGSIAQGVRRIALDLGERQRATVGSITLFPNLTNVIASKAVVKVDLRNPDNDQLQEAEARLHQLATELGEEEGVEITNRSLARIDPVTFDPAVIDAIDQSAQQLGYLRKHMISGAGHDAQIMGPACPTAMIFIPSKNGISHNTTEYSTPEDIEAGVNVLLHTLLRLADE